jgi:ABC-type uncharacterized transport system permease subunit
MAELFVWPAMIAYGEAVIAYAGSFRGHGLYGRAATWGVRIGWLAQTALLVVQALDTEGFPWGTWAGALNLFAWLLVSAYLIWGCKPGYRLLGLAVMPPALLLLVLAWAGGGTGIDDGNHSGTLLAVHVAFMLAGFAALTLAAGMSGLYLWEERRLKVRDSRLLRWRVPPLASLDRLAARTTLAAVGVLTIGIVIGLSRLQRGSFDAAMAGALVIWALFTVVLVLRRESGLGGRRAALATLAGFALVLVVLPITHFAS